MDLLQLAFLLVIAGFCGAIAQYLVAYSPGSLMLSIIVGVVGSYFGWLFSRLPVVPRLIVIGVSTVDIDLVWSVAGSLLLLVVLRALRSSGPRWQGLRR